MAKILLDDGLGQLGASSGSLGGLNRSGLSTIECAVMALCPFRRLRSLILIVAFALVGQAATPVITMLPGQDSMAGISMKSSSDMCPGCAGNDHSAAGASVCVVALCSGVVAVLPVSASQIGPVVSITYSSTVPQGERGITIRPDTAPPKLPSLA